MTYGLTIENRFGYLQADSIAAEHLVVSLYATASSTTITENPLTGWATFSGGDWYYRYVNVPSGITNFLDLLFFIRPTSLATNADIKITAAFSNTYAIVYATEPFAFNFAWFERSQLITQSSSSYGIEIINESGNRLFSSDQVFLNVKGFVNYTFNYNGSQTIPYTLALLHAGGGSWTSEEDSNKPFILMNTLQMCAEVDGSLVDPSNSFGSVIQYAVRFTQSSTGYAINLQLVPFFTYPHGHYIRSVDDSNQIFMAATIGV